MRGFTGADGCRRGTAGQETVHELGITENIVNLAVNAAEGRRVRHINLVLGELSGVVQEAISFCFDIVSRETAAEGASLSFVNVVAVVRCGTCRSEHPLNEGGWTCGRCGAPAVEIVRGKEFYMDSIEVDDDVQVS